MSRRWRVRTADDTGSMPMLMLVVIIGLALSALLVPMIVTQDRTTRFDTSRVHALDAAQAGIDVALGAIRNATTSGIGDSAKLPCGPISGAVTSNSVAAYSVTVEYFTDDPVGEPVPSTDDMICKTGYGTYDPTSGAYTPSYARLISTGTDGTAVNGSSAGRTIATTYKLSTTQSNIAGGLIRIYPASSSSAAMCMDAGSTTPASGVTITIQACSASSPPVARQVFAYRTDLTLQLLSSITTTYPNGLCLSSAAPAAANNSVTLAACVALGTTPPYIQQWSFNDFGAYQASQSTSRSTGDLPNLCMNVSAQTAGTAVKLAACNGSTSSSTQAWIPAASVGAGAAARPQWVNYFEFGRCMDVTNQNVSVGHLIDFPCKQNPSAGEVKWNQKFTIPATASGSAVSAVGQISTIDDSSKTTCLTTASTSGGYVSMQTCSSSSSLQKWKVYNGDDSLPYSVKYTIVDSFGRCLGLTSPVGAEQWSAIDVDTCTGSTEQKWNADPNTLVPTLQNTRELSR